MELQRVKNLAGKAGFVSRVRDRVVKLYKHRALQWVRNSLVWNMFKMLLLVMLLVWGLFLLAPRDAHVSFVPEKFQQTSMDASYMNFSNLITNGIGVQSNGAFILEPWGQSIFADGVEYPAIEKYIAIEPTHINSLGPASIYLRNTGKGNFSCSFDIGNVLAWSEYIDDDNVLTSSMFNVKNIKDLASVQIHDSVSNSSANDWVIDGFTNLSLSFYSESDISVTFFNSSAFIVDNDGNRIAVDECIIPPGDMTVFVHKNSEHNLNLNLYELTNNSNAGEILIRGGNHFSATGYGDMIFSYSPTSTAYTLHNQQTELESDGNLQTNITFNDSLPEYEISGMVTDASISGMSLFPTFLGWYRSNVYIAPITLLSTIFGGVALMLNNKRKE